MKFWASSYLVLLFLHFHGCESLLQIHYNFRSTKFPRSVLLKMEKQSDEGSCNNTANKSSSQQCVEFDYENSNKRPDKAMEETYDRLAKEAISTLTELGKYQLLWIGLAGAPGSGKSTLGEAVVERINDQGIPAVLVSMDGWHYTQEEMKHMKYDMKRRGAPWTIDAEKMYRDLNCAQSKCCCEAWLPGYSREISDPVSNQVHLTCDHRIIIVEGLYVLLGLLSVEAFIQGAEFDEVSKQLDCPHDVRKEIERYRSISKLWDQKWFVEPLEGFEENKRRLIERSLQTWTEEKTSRFGGGTARVAVERRVEGNDAKNGRLITCCKPTADILIHSI